MGRPSSRWAPDSGLRDVREVRFCTGPAGGRIAHVGAEAVLRQLAATGTADQVRAQLERWDDAADVVVIGLPPGIPWAAIERTLRAAAPRPPAAASVESLRTASSGR
jgi:hypothetical protein